MDILIRKKSKEPLLPLEYERDEQVAMLVGKIMKICHFNMVNPVLFSTATEEWYTPQDFLMPVLKRLGDSISTRVPLLKMRSVRNSIQKRIIDLYKIGSGGYG